MATGAFMAKRVVSRTFVRTLDVHYTDRRGTGGPLELSFKGANGALRGSLKVKSVKARPGLPLMRPHLRNLVPVEETEASMKISFEGREGGLQLGFSSVDEMQRVYALLSESSSSIAEI